MNIGSVLFVCVAGILVLVLPRRLAVIPLLLAVLYTTRIPVLTLGPANLSVLRVLVIMGAIRALARGESIVTGFNNVDRLLIAWAAVLIGVSVFHTPDAWTFRLGLVLGEVGLYFLFRILIVDTGDVRRLFRVLSIAAVPLAALLLLEKYTAHNYFELMGASGEVTVRDGHFRAAGPFSHAILAGTVGATLLPMALCLWRRYRLSALIGAFSSAGIIIASTSSGPIMMAFFTCLGLIAWNVRTRLRPIRWVAVLGIISLQLVMNDPVYFLMARIDLTGSSSGWFRSELIRSSIVHLDEWWQVGTDRTRHWMATGIPANEVHTDITNHFLQMGVWGGLPLLALFVLALVAAFRLVGTAIRQNEQREGELRFLIWTIGAMLFGQVINFWSISLFDQSVSLFYFVLAAVGAMQMQAAALPGLVSAANQSGQRRRPRFPRLVDDPLVTSVNAEPNPAVRRPWSVKPAIGGRR